MIEDKPALKTATITAKIDSNLKDKVEKVLDRLGLSHSGVINILYNQIDLINGIPFPINIPEDKVKKPIRTYSTKKKV